MPDLPTIFIVEDDPLLREVLSTSLTGAGFLVQVFPAAEEFLEAHTTEMRGCLLVDMRLPQMSGMALIEALIGKATRLPSVGMSAFSRTPLVVEAMRAGAIDFLEKPFGLPDLLRSIRVANLWASKGSSDARADAAAAAARVSSLTDRERSIFNSFATGASTKQIASLLSISTKTVETYRIRLLSKLDVDTPYALVRLAVLDSLFGVQQRERADDGEA